MNRGADKQTTIRAFGAVTLVTLLFAGGTALADEPPLQAAPPGFTPLPPSTPAPSPPVAPPPAAPLPAAGYPQQYPSPYPQQYPPPARYGQQPGAYPPGYAPPGYAPPGYAPPGYAPPGYAPPGYAPPAIENEKRAARVLPYEEGEPVPDGYRVESRSHRGLLIGGAATLGSTWFLSVLIGAFIDSLNNGFGGNRESVAWPLYIPVFGPFIGIPVFDSSGSGTFFLLIDGFAQAAGVGMIIGGALTTQKRLIRVGETKPSWSIVPTRMGTNGMGIGLVGTM